jgi:transposase
VVVPLIGGGCPVAIRTFPGNTANLTAFSQAVQVVRDKFGLSRLTLVGDREMITSARIETLKDRTSEDRSHFLA